MTDKPPAHRRAVIGNPDNFWLHSSRTNTFDLTHPAHPSSPPITPRLTLSTSTSPITLDPAKTALVVVDMQNFFLSPAFGRGPGPGHSAASQLQTHAIPAARKAGIRIIWLNWGLTDSDVETMPPAVKRAFGFEAIIDDDDGDATGVIGNGDEFKERLDGSGVGVDKHGSPRPLGGDKVLENGKDGRIYKGLGSRCGTVFLDGKEIDAGRLLMRDQWNSALYPPLDAMFEEGAKRDLRPDVWVHKNRMSGLWGADGELERFLVKEGIRSLLFTGVNTDQCVSGTLTDAFSKGYDCVMLDDGCGTTSPGFSQECIEYNAGRTWGFVASCKDLAKAADEMVQ
ncbi:hypothetical protein MBLNU457_6312t1 [Dothideomycetes sp. NU457]